MRTVILVPRRAGVPERDAIWAWCRERWERLHPDLPIIEGHHDEGPFNRSAAINLASRLADEGGRWDLAVIIDADVLIRPAQVEAAIARAAETGKVVWAFQWWAGTTQAAASRILEGDPKWNPDHLLDVLGMLHAQGAPNALGVTPVPADIPDGLEKVNPISWSCCFVVPREAFDRLGGFDERFAGWGWEDMAFQAAAVGLIGHERIPGALVHLWHPRAPGLGEDGANRRRNRQLGRRYMVALREKGLHDRPEPSDEAEMERDRQHLRRLAATEEHDRRGRPAPDLPDWSDYWPTLEELIESWKDGRHAGPVPRISVIVRTGGTPEAWPARRDYLEATLASLVAQVRVRGATLSESPAVVRMVLFSDWPREMTPELEAIGKRHGFYVVGEGNTGLTASMAKVWRYIGSRPDPFDYVLLAEDDFLFERPVDLADLIAVLEPRDHLVQIALLRDAFYAAEREAGGILGHPESEFERVAEDGHGWLEHQRFFTLNPSLFRRSLTSEPWPTGKHSEAVFGRRLWRLDGRRRSALWGEGEAWVTHLGEVRAGWGY